LFVTRPADRKKGTQANKLLNWNLTP